jgi:hypothetical protein
MSVEVVDAVVSKIVKKVKAEDDRSKKKRNLGAASFALAGSNLQKRELAVHEKRHIFVRVDTTPGRR